MTQIFIKYDTHESASKNNNHNVAFVSLQSNDKQKTDYM